MDVFPLSSLLERRAAGTVTRDVGPGDTIFVPATVPHRFHDVTEELRIVVVFAPAEHSRATMPLDPEDELED